MADGAASHSVVPIINPSGPSFVHLHVHTHYSMLDGACKVPNLVKRCKEQGMGALAITDHGAMFGVIEFFNACKAEGVKPIIGIEAYIAPGDRRDRSTPTGNAGEAAYHLVLLAQNTDGYGNLLKLATIAYREGFYYKPRIDKEVLRQFNKGIIATSACLGGEIPSMLKKFDTKAGLRCTEEYLQIFGPERFFIEVQKQGIKEQDEVNPELVNIARKLGCGIVGTNDVHFLKKEDFNAHDILTCISTNKKQAEAERMKYPADLYFKSPQEMAEALQAFPEAIDNTLRIAEMCNLELDFSKRYAPVYPVPAAKLDQKCPFPSSPVAIDQMKEDERYLRQLCEEGLEWRYGKRDVPQEIRDRLEKELKTIISKQFCSYFLIVWDFCNYARDNGIPVGARGSGVGTMVGYLLGLCNVDPLRYGLLFERFMDPSRSEMPDIDIDICQDGRQRVIEYVRQKYGHVAQIITFGTLAAKNAVKDVCRVLGIPLAEADRLTKMIPGAPGTTLATAMHDEETKKDLDLGKDYKSNPQTKQIVDIAQKLEGLCRNAGCHAAGVIICDQALDTIVPLYKDKDNNILTQFEGPLAEKVGLLKMDFLGLKTLSVITRAVKLVEQRTGEALDIEKIDTSDPKVYDLFRRGQTKGIFQFESGGMQDLLMKMKPDRIEDLIAANALYRPGPMALIPAYCLRKHGKEKVPTVHPIFDRILNETYGIMVYQEQVMQIFNQLGGIELATAYKLIKAISKKQTDFIAKQRPAFITGCEKNGLPTSEAEKLFEFIKEFGKYGFNKSHSARYAFVAFQTAYLKTYYPAEFMAALLTYEVSDTDKVVEYIEECRRLPLPDGATGIKVLPPDINESATAFAPVYEQAKGRKNGKAATASVIRFGLLAVRGVGEKAVEAIIAERQKSGPFKSIFDFVERVDLHTVAKSTIEALIKCGAFTGMGARSQLIAVLERAIEMAQQLIADKLSGQMNMFMANEAAAAAGPPPTPPLPDMEELPSQDLLKFEKELLGFYISSHPLSDNQDLIDRYTSATTRDIKEKPGGAEVVIGAMITRVKKAMTKNGRSAGQQMAMLTIEDLEGQIDAVMFAETYAVTSRQYSELVEPDSLVFIKGRVDTKRETPSIVVSEMMPISEAVARLTEGVALQVESGRHSPDLVAQIKPILMKHRGGGAQVYIQVSMPDAKKVTLRVGRDYAVKVDDTIVGELERVLGPNTVKLAGKGTQRLKLKQQAPAAQQLFEGGGPSDDDVQVPADQQVEHDMEMSE